MRLKVLGCSICVVVLLGVFKLWLANRRTQAHEVIDEERRARIAEMSYCGIHHLNRNSIPFGARAIEQGQEVEGIWNSCREPCETSQVKSSAALANDHDNRPRPREGVLYSSLHGIHEDIASPASSSSSAVTHSSTPSSTYHDCRSMGHPDEDVDDIEILPVQTDENSKTYKSSNTDNVTFRGPDMISMSSPLDVVSSSNRAQSLDSATHKGHAYGSARVYANTDHRKTNSGFEILPAGTLGARPEFPD